MTCLATATFVIIITREVSGRTLNPAILRAVVLARSKDPSWLDNPGVPTKSTLLDSIGDGCVWLEYRNIEDHGIHLAVHCTILWGRAQR